MTEVKNESTEYTDKVKKARERARDILRMKKINNNKQRIFNAEQDKQYFVKRKEALEKNLIEAEKIQARIEYKLSKLDTADPDYEDKKNDLENDLKHYQENEKPQIIERTNRDLAGVDQDIRRADDKIAEIQANIAKWETGENKVSIDELKILADKIIEGTVDSIAEEIMFG